MYSLIHPVRPTFTYAVAYLIHLTFGRSETELMISPLYRPIVYSSPSLPIGTNKTIQQLYPKPAKSSLPYVRLPSICNAICKTSATTYILSYFSPFSQLLCWIKPLLFLNTAAFTLLVALFCLYLPLQSIFHAAARIMENVNTSRLFPSKPHHFKYSPFLLWSTRTK